MSLYKHVPGKEAILDGVRELLLAEFAATLALDDDDLGWRAHLGRFANAYRALGLAHPEAFGLLARGAERAYVAGRAIAEAGLERLIESGLDRRTAILRPAHDRALRARLQPGRPGRRGRARHRDGRRSWRRSTPTSPWWAS